MENHGRIGRPRSRDGDSKESSVGKKTRVEEKEKEPGARSEGKPEQRGTGVEEDEDKDKGEDEKPGRTTAPKVHDIDDLFGRADQRREKRKLDDALGSDRKEKEEHGGEKEGGHEEREKDAHEKDEAPAPKVSRADAGPKSDSTSSFYDQMLARRPGKLTLKSSGKNTDPASKLKDAVFRYKTTLQRGSMYEGLCDGILDGRIRIRKEETFKHEWVTTTTGAHIYLRDYRSNSWDIVRIELTAAASMAKRNK